VKRFVNGDELELNEAGTDVFPGIDRLYVKTSSGMFTAAVARVKGDLVISYKGNQFWIAQKKSQTRQSTHVDSGELRAHMPGQIVDVRVEAGVSVQRGTTILVLEAMKTQQPFNAPFDGIVSEIRVAKGDQVTDGMVLATVTPLVPSHE